MGRRAVVIVLDGLGAGKAPDAADFGDEGANTLTNTARATGGLRAPNLQALGLGNVEEIEGLPPAEAPAASHGLMVELSAAKATLAGHWEMMGLVLDTPLPTYPEGFPEEICVYTLFPWNQRDPRAYAPRCGWPTGPSAGCMTVLWPKPGYG